MLVSDNRHVYSCKYTNTYIYPYADSHPTDKMLFAYLTRELYYQDGSGIPNMDHPRPGYLDFTIVMCCQTAGRFYSYRGDRVMTMCIEVCAPFARWRKRNR